MFHETTYVGATVIELGFFNRILKEAEYFVHARQCNIDAYAHAPAVAGRNTAAIFVRPFCKWREARGERGDRQ